MNVFLIYGEPTALKQVTDVLDNIGAEYSSDGQSIVTEDEFCETPDEFLKGLLYWKTIETSKINVRLL